MTPPRRRPARSTPATGRPAARARAGRRRPTLVARGGRRVPRPRPRPAGSASSAWPPAGLCVHRRPQRRCARRWPTCWPTPSGWPRRARAITVAGRARRAVGLDGGRGRGPGHRRPRTRTACSSGSGGATPQRAGRERRSGLGLTIVRQIAEAHGGEVKLVSALGSRLDLRRLAAGPGRGADLAGGSDASPCPRTGVGHRWRRRSPHDLTFISRSVSNALRDNLGFTPPHRVLRLGWRRRGPDEADDREHQSALRKTGERGWRMWCGRGCT